MQFEELQKVWDQQNQVPMYVLNEEALQQQIRRKGNKISRYISINEFGLLLISVFTVGNLALTSEHRTYALLVAIAMGSSCIYMMWGRYQRLKRKQEARSVLEELEYTIENSNYYIRFAQTFFLWFMLPIAGAMLYRLLSAEASIASWLLIIGSLALAFLLVRLELRYKHLPRKQSLEKLKEKLLEEPKL
jgi:membrane protein implicated in regulation of membrane protease activity